MKSFFHTFVVENNKNIHFWLVDQTTTVGYSFRRRRWHTFGTFVLFQETLKPLLSKRTTVTCKTTWRTANYTQFTYTVWWNVVCCWYIEHLLTVKTHFKTNTFRRIRYVSISHVSAPEGVYQKVILLACKQGMQPGRLAIINRSYHCARTDEVRELSFHVLWLINKNEIASLHRLIEHNDRPISHWQRYQWELSCWARPISPKARSLVTKRVSQDLHRGAQ